MKNTRGGKREGAGRPQVDEVRKTRTFRLTNSEHTQVKEFVNNLKKVSHISK